MIRSIAIAAAAVSLAAVPSYAAASSCRDAHGKFIKCAAKTAPAKPARCKDAKGKFAKCGTPGAKPA
jgi:hypothetical protein